MAYKYFIYSSSQLEFKKEMEQKQGKRFKLGYVLVGGRKRSITEINSSGKSRFSDFVVVTEGEESNFKYEKPGVY